MAYQNHHQRQPDFKTAEAYLAQAAYETNIGERNLRYCHFSHFKKEIGRAPTAADIPTIHAIAQRLSSIESGLYRESLLQEETINQQRLITMAREKFTSCHEREQSIAEQLTLTQNGDHQLAKKSAELVAQYQERTGFAPNPTLHLQLVEVARYAIKRENDLNQKALLPTLPEQPATIDSHVTNISGKIRIQEETKLMQQTCEQIGNLPQEKDFKGIQQQAALQTQKLEKEIAIQWQKEQQHQMKKELSPHKRFGEVIGVSAPS